MQPVTPDNGLYMRIAYAAAFIVYFGYALLLWRRNGKLRERARNPGASNATKRDRS
jgi:hypothetical protein